jgi:DNA-binding beta-propeller fold protein YncE
MIGMPKLTPTSSFKVRLMLIVSSSSASLFRRLGLASCLALVGGLVLGGAPAWAVTGYPEVLSPGIASSSSPRGVAVDQANGDLFVAEIGSVRMLSPVNRPTPSAGYTPGFTLEGSFVKAVGVSVDNTCYLRKLSVSECEAEDPSNGDVYVTDVEAKAVDKFDAAGAPVKVDPPENETNQFAAIPGPATPLSGPRGIAVDPANGLVYVADFNNSLVDVFEPTGVFLKQFSTGPSPGGLAGGLAFDSSGSDLYVVAGGNVEEFDPAGNPVIQPPGTPNEGTNLLDSCGCALAVAVDPATNDVFVAGIFEGATSVEIYDSTGKPLSPPAFSTSIGVTFGGLAVDGSSHAIMISDSSHAVIDVFQQLGLPLVTTGGASPKPPLGFILEGEVDPEGVEVKNCEFEYGISTVSEHKVPCAALPGLGAGEHAVHADVTGLQPSTTYTYRLTAANEEDITAGTHATGAENTFTTLKVPPVIDQPPPLQSVSGVTRRTAFLHAMINPEHNPTTYRFVYVEAAKYEPEAKNPYRQGASTPVESAGSGLGNVSVDSPPVLGLRPGTVYDFALAASGEGETTSTFGPNHQFTTLPPLLPEVSPGQVTLQSSTAATLTVTINAKGIHTIYELDLGTETEGKIIYNGARIFGQVPPGYETITLNLENLTPATTYHYQITASNEEGTTTGPPGQTFTTPTPPTPPIFTQPPTPPLLTTPPINFPKPEIKPHHKKKTKHRHKAKQKHRGKPTRHKP